VSAIQPPIRTHSTRAMRRCEPHGQALRARLRQRRNSSRKALPPSCLPRTAPRHRSHRPAAAARSQPMTARDEPALDSCGTPPPHEPWLPALPSVTAERGPADVTPAAIRAWFDEATDAAIPSADGTLAAAQAIAAAFARRAKADNTRRAYRAGVRAWCAWCDSHGLPPLPARPEDVAAFLAAQRYVAAGTDAKPLATNTLKLRLAAIAYLHYLAGLPSPTTTAVVTETYAGLHRVAVEAGGGPRPKLAARIALLREILAPIPDDLPGLRDQALLLLCRGISPERTRQNNCRASGGV